MPLPLNEAMPLQAPIKHATSSASTVGSRFTRLFKMDTNHGMVITCDKIRNRKGET